MKKTTLICDACCDIMTNEFMRIDDINIQGSGTRYDVDLCSKCCRHAIRRYIKSRGIKLLRNSCSECASSGKVRVKDEEATSAQASCGENRIQYKLVECETCKF